ncbi:hypothetical protein BJV82DRAFT_635716 [Fennellomyces sp. T-0311]|nr:hypothetical protein BJV82DRAFT_635716 [Fennellomyces sp. T-0311]
MALPASGRLCAVNTTLTLMYVYLETPSNYYRDHKGTTEYISSVLDGSLNSPSRTLLFHITMVQLNFFATTGLVTVLAFLHKVQALPGVGFNLNDQQLYVICPLEETGRGDTATCCAEMKGAMAVGQGVDVNCQIPVVDLLADLPGVVNYLACCTSSVKQTHGNGGSCYELEEDP